jgi:hypothetical protein
VGARGLTLPSLAALAVLGACGHPVAPSPAAMPDRVAVDFEKAVLASKAAYVDLFDFVAVGEYEILLHRYDLDGRVASIELTDEKRAQFSAEDGTPYPPTRERRNVGNFYPLLAQRTVGTGDCHAAAPRSEYGKTLGVHFEPLPAGTPPGYDKLRADANAWLDRGGVVGITCSGGQGGLAVVYTQAANARGYNLITIYDD